MGGEPQGDARPLQLWCLFQLVAQLPQIDAAFGLSFFDIEVAFEIVVPRVFRDFSKGPQAKWNTTVLGPVLSPRAFARGDKSNMGAGEIDAGSLLYGIEIRGITEARVGEICRPLETTAREISLAIEPCACKRDGSKAMRPTTLRSE
jgi:hypothetical protein